MAKELSLFIIETTMTRLVSQFYIEKASQALLEQDVFLGFELDTNYKLT
jgi:hypothetical protein